MMLKNNEETLINEFKHLWKGINLANKKWEIQILTPTETKSGLPSLFIEDQSQSAYLHSKYDPVNEAEQWINKYEAELLEYDHVFFYGIGFGYHIEYFLKKYPNKLFILYEPNPFIFKEYLKKFEIKSLLRNKRGFVYIENDSLDIEHTVNEILEKFQYECTVIIHPVYERIFQGQTKRFFGLFKQLISTRHINVISLSEIIQLTTLNCINNFGKLLSTPNILREKKGFFKGKPVLIVAAGPSLEDEIENIRIIKERGLAFIFAVGSANKALLSANIYPDAICSYDPYDLNIQVFDIIIKQNITNIPLIYGSSIAHSVTGFYPGPMLHFISSRDPISKHYLAYERFFENNEFISDASFISNITLDLLGKLGCQLIVFVGQNFAFKNEQFYSKGIDYEHLKDELSKIANDQTEYVESVEGKQIASLKSFSLGRVELEKKIALLKEITIINTTKGGARIKGTLFMELENVMSEKFNGRIVENDWYKADNRSYNIENLTIQTIQISKHFEALPMLFNEIVQTIKNLEKNLKLKYEAKMLKVINLLIKQIQHMTLNTFFITFIESEVHFHTDRLMKSVSQIQYCTTVSEKAKLIVEAYSKYLEECQIIYKLRSNLFNSFQEYLYKTVIKNKGDSL